ncbi:MAG: rRNA (adenine2503-C2)-methyltransferase, partial [Verrucomicrobiota bacterium]|nr:rRNA (adenine2503-C2)-methyltransferase [Verrucomicrobiota bacterium]
KLEAKINFIPYNTVQGLSWKRPCLTRQQSFYRAVRKIGADVTIRREKGHDIDAACGQLRLQTMRDKNFAGSNNLR